MRKNKTRPFKTPVTATVRRRFLSAPLYSKDFPSTVHGMKKHYRVLRHE